MNRALSIFCILIHICASLTFVGNYPLSVQGGPTHSLPNCPTGPTGPAGCFPPVIPYLYTPTYVWIGQYYSYSSSIFGKNYSAVPAPGLFACTTLPPVYAGSLVLTAFNGDSPCDFNTMVSMITQAGAVAGIVVAPFPQTVTLIKTGSVPPPGMAPILSWANFGAAQGLGVQSQLPMSIAAVGGALALGSVNVTLDYPEANPLFQAWNTVPSGLSFIYWFSIFLALLALTLVCVQLGLFLFNGYWRSLASAVLILSYFGCVILVFSSFGMIVQTSPGSPASFNGYGFFEWWAYPFCLSGTLLLGFYFIEVASLTSAQTVPGLNLFKIPVICLVAAVWILTIIISFIAIFYNTGDPKGADGPERYAVAVIFGIAIALQLGICVYGAIVLLISMGPKKSLVLPFICLALLCSLNVAWGFSFYIGLRWFATSATPDWTEEYLTIIYQFVRIWPPAFVFIGFAFMFRVKVEKEIEVSKTATSSTSSSDSRGSSKSSSSSTQSHDPVIEL